MASLLLPLFAALAAAAPSSATNPHRLWDTSPAAASTFPEYYPLGNGRLGVLASCDPRTEQIRLNENSFWSGSLLSRVNPDAAETVLAMRQMLKEGRYAEAEDLGIMGYTGTPMSTRHFDKMGNMKLSQMYPEGAGEVAGYERWLGVDDAVAGAAWTVGNVSYSREYLASYVEDVVAVRVRGGVPGSVTLRVRMDRGADLNRFEGWSGKEGGDTVVMGGESMDARPVVWAAGVRVVAEGGRTRTVGDTVVCEGADEAVVLFQAWTNYRKGEPRRAVVEGLKGVTKGFEQIKAEHVRDYQKYAQRVELSLGESTAAQRAMKTSARVVAVGNIKARFDPELVKLWFDYGRYLFISTSRPEKGGDDRSLPPNLQGVWNDVYTPMWGSKYTLNINLQMNYWASLVTGLSDLVTPLNNLLKKMGAEGRKVAAEMYNSTGTVTHHNTDMWGDSAPQDNYAPATFWNMGATWMITHVIEQYRFTGDKAVLRDMFPTLKDIAQFGLDFLSEHKGYMVTNPSSSPENTFVIPGKPGSSAAVAPGPTVDNALLREVFGFIPEAQAALGINDEAFAKKVLEMRARLPPLRLNQYGGIAEWMEDYEEANPGNGHVSHLVPVYPLSHITSANETLFEAARTSLHHRLDNGGGSCGWPAVWAIALAGRLQLPEIAHERLLLQLGPGCTWNRTLLNMGGTAPFQIDGSLGAPAVMVEAFLQSHETVSPLTSSGAMAKNSTAGEAQFPLLRLLPSLPKVWAASGGGHIKGLRTRGAFVVDLDWNQAGELATAKLTSEGDNTVYVTLGQGRVGMEGNGTRIQAEGAGTGGFLRLQGKKGTVFTVTLAGKEVSV